jgi:hypothetical protein
MSYRLFSLLELNPVMFTFQHLEANGTAALLTRNDRSLLALDPPK